MTKSICLAMISCGILFLSQSVSAAKYEDIQQLDISGDKLKDMVQIQADNTDSGSLENMMLRIVFGGSEKKVDIPLSAGTKPALSYADFNHDGIKDVLVTLQSAEADKLESHVYSFKNQQKTDLEFPLPVDVTGRFRDRYRASIEVQNHTYQIDVADRKKEYEGRGLYYKGKLNEPMELIVSPYVEVRATYTVNGYSIRGVQQISGAFEEDVLGEVVSVWIYQAGKWKLQQASFQDGHRN
ncbi:MAG: hypothetical protein ACI35R_00820 [Bacillus sp. (in: firmicutes)]